MCLPGQFGTPANAEKWRCLTVGNGRDGLKMSEKQSGSGGTPARKAITRRAEAADLEAVAALDERLNDNAYIVPGLGDAGDRLFGTKHA